jgi:hypothetical protein
VLEDVRGLKWAENGRYVLFAHHHGNGERVDDLFSTPNQNRTYRNPALRVSRPEIPAFTPVRLEAPWRFTREAVYVEAYSLSTSHTNETSTYIVELQRSFASAHRCLVSEFTMNNAKRKDALVINTDDSSFHNGKADAIAGIGVYFGPRDNR